jgi:hypothetical protein
LIRGALDEELAAHLLGKDGEDFEAESGAFARMKFGREADAIISDDEFAIIARVAEGGGDAALTPMREGMLEAIGECLIERESERHEPLGINTAILNGEAGDDLLGWHLVAFTQVLNELAGEVTEGATTSEGELIEMLVKGGDGADAQPLAEQGCDGGAEKPWVTHGGRLKICCSLNEAPAGGAIGCGGSIALAPADLLPAPADLLRGEMPRPPSGLK